MRVILTPAPDTPPPLASVTLPTIEPKATCARTGWLNSTRRQTRANIPQKGSRPLEVNIDRPHCGVIFVIEPPSGCELQEDYMPGLRACPLEFPFSVAVKSETPRASFRFRFDLLSMSEGTSAKLRSYLFVRS